MHICAEGCYFLEEVSKDLCPGAQESIAQSSIITNSFQPTMQNQNKTPNLVCFTINTYTNLFKHPPQLTGCMHKHVSETTCRGCPERSFRISGLFISYTMKNQPSRRLKISVTFTSFSGGEEKRQFYLSDHRETLDVRQL